jgi:hypothetical protein
MGLEQIPTYRQHPYRHLFIAAPSMQKSEHSIILLTVAVGVLAGIRERRGEL